MMMQGSAGELSLETRQINGVGQNSKGTLVPRRAQPTSAAHKPAGMTRLTLEPMDAMDAN